MYRQLHQKTHLLKQHTNKSAERDETGQQRRIHVNYKKPVEVIQEGVRAVFYVLWPSQPLC